MADVKICGVTTPEALDAALTGGARFVGFVIFPRSPRHLARDRLAALAARARGRAEIVAVTVDADDETLQALAQIAQPDLIQLHGSESPARTAHAAQYARRGVIKALGVAGSEDFGRAAAYEAVADMLLFDAKPHPGGLPGGNAAAFDWGLLSGRSFGRPWMLSGGLTPQNVAAAISASGAALVDVSSGVESSPGLKDPGLIAHFLAAARA
jgi:phosphoribosylanthranilate isomerase